MGKCGAIYRLKRNRQQKVKNEPAIIAELFDCFQVKGADFEATIAREIRLIDETTNRPAFKRSGHARSIF